MERQGEHQRNGHDSAISQREEASLDAEGSIDLHVCSCTFYSRTLQNLYNVNELRNIYFCFIVTKIDLELEG